MNFKKRFLVVPLLFWLGCASSQAADPQIWRPTPGQRTETIPGPLKSFGSFDNPSEALKAACPLILSKPNATVVHLQQRDPKLALRVSTEYCAWLYYTPENRYELSMLTDVPAPGSALQGEATCLLPPNVDDPRYAPSSIRYIILLHNHPFSSEISKPDVNFAIAMANAHALIVEAAGRTIPLSVVAFFSKSKDGQNPACDGFYQYIPATSELQKWTNTNGDWKGKKVGMVNWINETEFNITQE
jgi:hypothetical protein